MGKQRQDCPPEIRTALRKEANLGCVKCGKPLTTIHHIEGYDENKPWPQDHLVILCQEHHREADHKLQYPESSGGITKEALYTLKRTPFNYDIIRSSFKVSSTKPLTVKMGGMTVIECPIVLEILGEPIIEQRREGDQILFSLRLYDMYDNKQFEMIDNVWEADTDLLDLRYSENKDEVDVWISVNMRGSESYTEVKLMNDELHIVGKFYRHGQVFDATPDEIFNITDGKTIQCFIGSVCAYGRVAISLS